MKPKMGMLIALACAQAPTARTSAPAPPLSLDTAHRLAFVAGEDDRTLAVFDLEAHKVLSTHRVGDAPDVLAFDSALGLLYVAAESGVVSVFEERGRDLVARGSVTIPHAHSVSVDPSTHHVYLPLESVGGRPVLRIMEPSRPR